MFGRGAGAAAAIVEMASRQQAIRQVIGAPGSGNGGEGDPAWGRPGPLSPFRAGRGYPAHQKAPMKKLKIFVRSPSALETGKAMSKASGSWPVIWGITTRTPVPIAARTVVTL